MTCEEFDDLRARAGGRCEICQALEECLPEGLYLDHDHTIGLRAVRGLLCPRCNVLIEYPTRFWGARFAAYLATPWYSRFDPKRLDEPVIPPVDPEHRARVLVKLAEVGEQFRTMRRTHGRAMPPQHVLDFARRELYPAILAARAVRISAREVANKTGYTVESVYLIWRRNSTAAPTT